MSVLVSGSAITCSTTFLWKAPISCWRNTVVAIIFQSWNPLIANASSAFLALMIAFVRHAFVRRKSHSFPCSIATFTSPTRLFENFILPQLVSHTLALLGNWKLYTGWRAFSTIGREILEFAYIELQRRQHTIRTIIALEAAHAQNDVAMGKVPRPYAVWLWTHTCWLTHTSTWTIEANTRIPGMSGNSQTCWKN